MLQSPLMCPPSWFIVDPRVNVLCCCILFESGIFFVANNRPLHLEAHLGFTVPPNSNSWAFSAPIPKSWCLVIYCLSGSVFNLESKKGMVDKYQPGTMEYSHQPPYRKNLLVHIWFLNNLWVYGLFMWKKEDHQKEPSGSVFIFPRNVICVYLCVFCLCFLSSCTRFSFIPKMRQVQSTHRTLS